MGELIPIAEATRRLGISKSTMLRRLKSAKIRRYINPKDSRQRLIDWDEVEGLFAIRPEDVGQPKKWRPRAALGRRR
jgi:hypothetical protein